LSKLFLNPEAAGVSPSSLLLGFASVLIQDFIDLVVG
jgi:hypothetical protein